MNIRSKILASIVASIIVAALIVLVAFTFLRGMSHELARSRLYGEVISKTHALNVLIASAREGSSQSQIRQLRTIVASLDDLLKKMSHQVPREEALISQLLVNNKELGPLIDQVSVEEQEVAGGLEKERRNVLASQIWMKVRFISDDTYRLNDIAQARIAAAQDKTGATIIGLILLLALATGTIYFFAGRDIRKSHDELELRVAERTAQLEKLNQELNAEVEERKRAERELVSTVERLELLNSELQEFAFVASHDLQEPLRKIQTFCDLAQKRCATTLTDDGHGYLDRVINSAIRMRQLLDDLLQFSRVATRQKPFKRINLAEIAREAADVFEDILRSEGGTVEIMGMPQIEADETQMLRLFQNLIGNALKFRGNDSPRIKVYAKSTGKRICEIFIEDNGMGFDPQFKDLIFKPFQRLHGRKKYEGTGMGLAICRKIVERHSGIIEAESMPGKGSVLKIKLPLIQARRESA